MNFIICTVIPKQCIMLGSGFELITIDTHLLFLN